MNTILAFDQSLTSTGVCVLANNYRMSDTLTPKDLKGIPRLSWFSNQVRLLLEQTKPVAVVMEGYSFGSKFSQPHSLGELGGVIKLVINDWAESSPSTAFYLIPPTTLKKFVSGKGTSKKQEVLMHIYKRWGIEFSDDNKADAFALALAGWCLYYGMLPDPFGSTLNKEMAACLPVGLYEPLVVPSTPVRRRSRKAL